MKKAALLAILFLPLGLSLPVLAQGLPLPPALPSFQDQGAPVTGSPQCFNVRNMTEGEVLGVILTDSFTRDDGVTTRHRSTFRLMALGERERESGHFIDRAEFCTTGPFYPGGKIGLELKTLFPVFSCKTRIDQGDILIRSSRIDGAYKLWAECFE